MRKDKRKLNSRRIDKLSRDPRNLSDVTKVIENQSMWATFDKAVKRARASEEVGNRTLNGGSGHFTVV